MKTLSLLAAGWLGVIAAGMAAPGGAAGIGTAGAAGGVGAATGGGHAGAGGLAGRAAGASSSGGRGSTGFSGYAGSSLNGRASVGGSGAGIVRSPGVSAGQVAATAALPPMPTVRNAWSDPVGPRLGAASAAGYGSHVGNLHVGNNLYPGAYGYVPTRPAGNAARHGRGGDSAGRGNRRNYYNNFPYPVYYPFLYGGYGDEGLGYGSAVGDLAGGASGGETADLGAPDFSASAYNYYSYPSPGQGAPDQGRATTAPQQPLPDAPAVGPQEPSAAAQPPAGVQQGPDSLVEAVQEELGRRGYFAGRPDAVYSGATKEAIRRFQTDQGLPATGRINEATLHALHLD